MLNRVGGTHVKTPLFRISCALLGRGKVPWAGKKAAAEFKKRVLEWWFLEEKELKTAPASRWGGVKGD